MILQLFRALVILGVMGGLLFASAGRWDLPFFWAILGVLTFWALVGLFVADPGMVQERYRAMAQVFTPALRPPQEDPRSEPGRKELLVMMVLLMPCLLAVWVIPGLDVGRYHWSDNVPFGVQLAGLIAYTVSGGLMTWAAAVNAFFSVAVRIQSERGHRVITTGPYRYVRHPAYIGGIVWFLSIPLALGSWWALVPVVPIVLLILRRTALEDRFLRAELAGYAAYADKVRYRLVPGLW